MANLRSEWVKSWGWKQRLVSPGIEAASCAGTGIQVLGRGLASMVVEVLVVQPGEDMILLPRWE